VSDDGVIIIDRGWRKYRESLKKLNGASVQFGLPAGTNNLLLKIALDNEQGAVRKVSEKQKAFRKREGAQIGDSNEVVIPERSFLRSSFDENEKVLYEKSAEVYDQVTGGGSLKGSLDRLGVFGVKLIREKLKNGPFKENDPFTRKKKGEGKKPLENRGTLPEAMTHKVVLK